MGIVDNALIGASGQGGYFLSRSLRFRASASANLSRTPSVTGNRKVWTWSAWVKRGSVSTSDQYLMSCTSQSGNDGIAALYFSGNQLFTYYDTNTTNPAGAVGPAVYRDPSSWYHIVWSVDAANSIHYVYVNGVLVSTDTSKYPVNYDYAMNRSGYVQKMGTEAWGTSVFSDLYMAEVNFIDGQALTASSFGSTNTLTGVWQPARYGGTYGTNGFYLPFTDNSALTTSSNVGLGKDFSGNGNYWTTNNISITSGTTYDSMTDVPTLTSATAANFAVLNPLRPSTSGQVINGNLTSSDGGYGVYSTIQIPSTGKWYAEFNPSSVWNTGAYLVYGTMAVANAAETYSGVLATTNGSNGGVWQNSSLNQVFTTWATTDIVGLAVDMGTRTVQCYRNGSTLGTAVNVPSGDVWFYVSSFAGGNVINANFGQRPFSYTPPTGYVALNTYNLPTSTIVKGNTVMDATLYTGNGSTNAIANSAGFKPDFVWGKSRSLAQQHLLFDSVRGVGNYLQSQSTAAEGFDANTLTSFNSNGFTLGSNITINTNASTNVAWQWQAGQGTTSSNTSGTITSTVSVNASAGFSVVTFTGNGATSSGQTIGHGLGVTPAFIITKKRSSGTTDYGWSSWHKDLGGNYGIWLNLSNARNPGMWTGYTNINSSVFSPPDLNYCNESGQTYVAYCWTPIAGYSAFGSYTGNGSSDGPMVYTGFRPKYVLVKCSSSDLSGGAHWVVQDSSRSTYNAADAILYPNLSNAEGSGEFVDLLSNGFKIRNTVARWNSSGATFIYIAFAENPFKNALAR